MKIGKWSTTAANNNATAPDGWPEGQAPSTVNDCGREMMASVKTAFNTLEYLDYDNTPSFLTTTTFSLGTADTTNWEIGRRVKLFDATTLYGTIISVSATFVQVRLDAGVLTASLSSAALGVLRNTSPSLPDAAYQQQNAVINGAFDLWQRTASMAGVLSNQYVADRFKYIANNGASVNIYRDTNAPTLASAGVVLNSSMTIVVSAVDAAIAVGDFAGITYVVEGKDWRQIAHRPMGLSFQASTNKSGIYAVSIRSGAGSASYVQNFTMSAVNTWTRFFVPIPAAPTSPYTWDYSIGLGLNVTWTLAAGATYQSTASEWTAMQALATSSQVNFLSSASNTFSLADVRLKTGLADSPVAFRSGATELELAQRYYETGQSTMYFLATAISEERRNTLPFATTKRTTPTVTLSGGTQVNITLSAPVNPTSNKFDHRVVGTAAGAVNDDGATWTSDAEL